MRTNREVGAHAAPELRRVPRVDDLPSWVRGDLPERVRALDLEAWARLVEAIIYLSLEVPRLTRIRDEEATGLMRQKLLESLETVALDLGAAGLPVGLDSEAAPARAIAEVSVRRVMELSESLNDIPAVRDVASKLSAARIVATEAATDEDSPQMTFPDPLRFLLGGLTDEATTLMETPVEDALSAHEQAWLQSEMLQGGPSIDIPLEPPLTRLVEVNVYATEEELLEEFRSWLRETKQKHPDAVHSNGYGRSHFKKWAAQGLVPYRLAMLWAELEGRDIPLPVAADLIAESRPDAVSDSYPRNVTLKNSEVVFSDSTLNTLKAQLRSGPRRK